MHIAPGAFFTSPGRIARPCLFGGATAWRKSRLPATTPRPSPGAVRGPRATCCRSSLVHRPESKSWCGSSGRNQVAGPISGADRSVGIDTALGHAGGYGGAACTASTAPDDLVQWICLPRSSCARCDEDRAGPLFAGLKPTGAYLVSGSRSACARPGWGWRYLGDLRELVSQ
jgi:hypothetical protein